MTDQILPYAWARVTCPTCGAEPDHRCRTLATNRTTDAHKARIEMGYRWLTERRNR